MSLWNYAFFQIGSIVLDSTVYSDPGSPILINGLSCTGEENTITECLMQGSTCTSQTRARVICQGVCVCVLCVCVCVCGGGGGVASQ